VNALAFLEELADLVADRVVARLHEGRPGWVDQHGSPLGPKRHCAAVRRRVASGSGDAAIVGRRMLLSPEALAEELSRASRRAKPIRSEGSVTDDLARELRLVRKAGSAAE
jgi:hypothetical protein